MKDITVSTDTLKQMIIDADNELANNVTILRNLYSMYKGNDYKVESERLVARNEYLRHLMIMLSEKIKKGGANDN